MNAHRTAPSAPAALDSPGSEQTHLLADPSVEARVAMVVATTAYQCPECYFKEREAKIGDARGVAWPKRMRWEADVARPCTGCGRNTYWCVAGPWQPGKGSAREEGQ